MICRRINIFLSLTCITTPLRTRSMLTNNDAMRSISGTTVNPVHVLNGKIAAEKICRKLVPPLDNSSYKGQMGRIGVLGGSPDYSGAPYYAAESALKFGADLSFVFCAQQAAIPIKSYSPELMVTPFYDMNTINEAKRTFSDNEFAKAIQDLVNGVVEFFPRLHSLVIGPGLGRDKHVLDVVAGVIRKAKEADIPLVIDADGLWLISQNIDLIRGYKKCILTPNAVEFDRLVAGAIESLSKTSTSKSSVSVSEISTTGDIIPQKTKGSGSGSGSGSSSSSSSIDSDSNRNSDSNRLIDLLKSPSDTDRIRALCTALGGVTVFRKGASDMISSGDGDGDSDSGAVYVIHEEGSPRRCGGQGDILAGCMGVASYWAWKRASYIPTIEALSVPEYSDVFSNTDSSSINSFSNSRDKDKDSSNSVSSGGNVSIPPSPSVCAALMASVVTKRASKKAFQVHKRSMTSPQVMEQIGAAFDELFGDS